MPPPPNVLWIQTDEQRPDSLGCYGSAWAKTPNVDALAAAGTVFHECHVPSPLCVPSRTAMELGRYPQELGVVGNGPGFQEGLVDPMMKAFPNVFADAGHRTASFGKWHTPVHPTFQENFGFDQFLHVTGYFGLAAGYDEGEHHIVASRARLLDHLLLAGDYPFHDHGCTISSFITDLAIAWIRERVTNGERFLVRVSHLWPHTPVLVPRPWRGAYEPGEVPFTPPSRDLFEERSAYDRWLVSELGGLDLTVDEWRQMVHDYYALCAYVDHEIGRVLRCLADLGVADDTIVAVNADHGRGMGEYGLFQKSTYDREVWRVPFILTYPRAVLAGQHRRDLCELMDLYPTLCALAGLEPPAGTRGRDLFGSASAPHAVGGIVQTGPRTRAAVRTERYRYDFTCRVDDRDTAADEADANLFDLVADPFERDNLAHAPEHAALRAELRAGVVGWLGDAGAPLPAV